MSEIICRVYNKKHVFQSSKQAQEFFLNCLYNSEGSEQSRYADILEQLAEGNRVCSDEW